MPGEIGVPKYVPAENLSFKRRGSRRTQEFRTDQKRPQAISEEEMQRRWDMAFGTERMAQDEADSRS